MGLDERRRRASLRLSAIALAWSLALIAGAFLAPVYQGDAVSSAAGVSPTSATLVQANGVWVAGLVALPALVSLIVLAALAHRGRRRAAALLAGAAVGALVAFNALALFTIGVFILPASALLARALWPARARPRQRSVSV